MALATPDFNSQPDSQSQKVITLRAVLLGIVTMLISTVYMDYHAGNLVKSYLPVAVVIPFLGWVLLNAFLKIFAPRLALEHNEILTIFGMVWVGGNLPAVGWALHSVSAIPAPDFFASPENRIREVVIPLLPQWLCFPRLPGLQTGHRRFPVSRAPGPEIVVW